MSQAIACAFATRHVYGEGLSRFGGVDAKTVQAQLTRRVFRFMKSIRMNWPSVMVFVK
jgi:hypothetical protein